MRRNVLYQEALQTKAGCRTHPLGSNTRVNYSCLFGQQRCCHTHYTVVLQISLLKSECVADDLICNMEVDVAYPDLEIIKNK